VDSSILALIELVLVFGVVLGLGLAQLRGLARDKRERTTRRGPDPDNPS
jgi:hypothetical protein